MALTMATSRSRSLALWWVQRRGAATLIAQYEYVSYRLLFIYVHESKQIFVMLLC